MPLHLDYRPKKLGHIIGNDGTVTALEAMFKNRNPDDYPHAFLFHGPSGCGKTTLARIVAGLLGCPQKLDDGLENPDFSELDIAQLTGVDTARDIRRLMRFKPMRSDVRVWVLDEVHMGSKNFMNGMLKATEDPPGHVFFLLCTTEPNGIIPTLRKRCTPFEVSLQPDGALRRLLLEVLDAEGIDVMSDDVIDAVVRSANGAPRDLLVNADKILDLDPNEMMDAINEGEAATKAVIDLCRGLLKNEPWKEIAAMLKDLKDEPEKVRHAVLGYMNSVVLKSGGSPNPRALYIMNCFREPNFYNGKPGLTMACAETYIDD